VGVVDEPVTDGIGYGFLADDFMPDFDRKLAGDDVCLVRADVEEFEDQPVLAGLGLGQAPVVDDQQVEAAVSAKVFADAAVGVSLIQFTE
jgi:hypothetical protein